MKKTVIVLLILVGMCICITNGNSIITNQEINCFSIESNSSKIDQVITPINSLNFYQSSEDTIKYDGGNVSGIGISGGGTLWGAVRFTPITTTPATHCTLKSVIFYQYQPVTVSGWVYIHEAGTATAPGEKIDSAPYANAPGTWIRVNFPTPRVRPVGIDFWLSVKLTHASGQYPLGVDGGPSVSPARSFVSTDGTTWQSLPSAGINRNLNIRAIVRFPLFTNDVGVEAIIAPGVSHIVNTLMTPIALVKNYGTATQTNFPIVCSIIGLNSMLRYTDTQTIASLLPGETTRVIFTSWTPQTSGLCSVKMRTVLSSDENPTNDQRTRTTDIGVLYENFNDTIFPPPGWTVYNFDGGSQTWRRWTTNPYSPPACAVCRWESSTLMNNDWLITPRLGPIGLDDSLFFYYRAYSNANWETLLVRVSTNSNISDTANYVVVDLIATNSDSYNERAISLSAFAGQQVFIAFQYACLFKWRIYLDDISLRSYAIGIAENAPICLNEIIHYPPKPNPISNGEVKISFILSKPNEVALKIYDASGKLVKILLNSKLASGTYCYTWNGKDENNQNVANGIYFYLLETPNHTYRNKIILMSSSK